MTRRTGRIFWPLASVLLFADCSSKRVIEHSSAVGTTKPVVGNLLRFTLEYNQGAAFSTHFGVYQRWVLIAFALAILIVLGRSYDEITSRGLVATIGLALVAGGAAGNMLDRLISQRGVVDFINVGTTSARFFIFNIADAGISVGAALLVYAFWHTRRSRQTTS